jgi:hypothetical protein
MHIYAGEDMNIKYNISSLTGGVIAVGKTSALWKTGARGT